VAESLPAKRLLGSDDATGYSDSEDHPDPHVWMDVAMWAETLPVVTEALTAYAPQHAEDFRANAQRYHDELRALHQYGIESIGTIPPPRRQLITSHDAFGYFGRAYGLEVRGVQGLSTDSEAGLMRINQLVDLIVGLQIAAVFVESSVPRKSLEAVIEGASARGHRVVIGGELFSDSGGAEGTYEGTYVGMMDHNFTSVTRALGGSASAGGFRGQLSAHAQSAEDAHR
jgi:manganese/zinc/iron transport system substrate-binding protein